MPTALASTCIRAILVVATICAAAQGREPDSSTDALPAGALARLGTLRMRHGGEVLALAFSPDGKTLLSGGGQCDHTVRLWALATGECRLRVQLERPVEAVMFSQDGKRFAVSSGTFGADSE